MFDLKAFVPISLSHRRATNYVSWLRTKLRIVRTRIQDSPQMVAPASNVKERGLINKPRLLMFLQNARRQFTGLRSAK